MRRSTAVQVIDPLANDTLTARDIAQLYVQLHDMVHGTSPECYHLEGLWFWVEGERRDRHWLILQVERLRQQIVAARNEVEQDGGVEGAIYKSLRRMARLI